jgi:hypothetical protein
MFRASEDMRGTEMEVGDAAGWVGGVAGVAGLVYAHLANRHSSKANGIAHESNEIARQANDKSSESNRIAERANRFAQEANDYAQRSDARSTERDDVRWEGRWVRPGVYELVQQGLATAHEVVAVITVDDETQRITQEQVLGGETLLFQFADAARTLADERAQLERARQDARSAPLAAVVSPDPMSLGFLFHTISERVDWASSHGIHKMHDEDFRLCALGDHE